MNLETQLQEGEQTFAHIWKVTALRGACDRVRRRHPRLAGHRPDCADRAVRRVRARLGSHESRRSVQPSFGGGQRAWLVSEGGSESWSASSSSSGPTSRRWGCSTRSPHRRLAIGIFEIALAFVLPFSGGRSLLVVLGRSALGCVRRDHVLASRCGSGGPVGARRGVRARDRCHADRIRVELRRVVVELDQRVRPHATAKPVTQG